MDGGFNRTFMELKSFSWAVICGRIQGFNRTFMELKSHTFEEFKAEYMF